MKKILFLICFLSLLGCSKELGSGKTNTVEAMTVKGEELIRITFNSNGCFHSQDDSLRVIKENKQYFLVRMNQKKEISKKEYGYLLDFEKQLGKMSDKNFCTTIETFIIVKDDTSDTVVDRGCNFDGYKKLKEFLKRNGFKSFESQNY